MFGIDAVEPWIGRNYATADPKMLVVGDSRYSEAYNDRMIVQDQVDGRRDPVFTRFTQAVLGKPSLESGYDAEAKAFWESAAFYNYNTTCFPATAGTPLDWAARTDPQNVEILNQMLRTFRPTHAVVWGFANWDSLVQGVAWTRTGTIPGRDEPCRTAVVDGHTTLFTCVLHPSSPQFTVERWAPMLSAFRSLRP